MNRICADSGLLIALYDERDAYHSQSLSLFQEYFEKPVNQLLIPWPVMYETISTRMARQAKQIQKINKDWGRLRRSGQLEYLDDAEFRLQALDDCFEETARGTHYRPLSLVDRVLRNILSSRDLKIKCFITYNRGDYHDILGKVELIPTM